jgi:hypothetical protein
LEEGLLFMSGIMEGSMSRIRENSSPLKGKKMDTVAEAKSAFRWIPRGADQSKLNWLSESVAPFFGLTFSQAKKIEYGEVKDLRASRLDHIREKLRKGQERAGRREETTNGIKERLAYLRSAQGSGDRSGDSGGVGATDGRSMGASTGGSGESRRAAAVAGSDED